MTNWEIKHELLKQCNAFIEFRLKAIQSVVAEIQVSLTSESKSSAGDKHETGRAMLQLEREKAGQQLAEIEKLKQHLLKINIEKSSQRIHLGSVIFTNQANYFIAISAGELHVSKHRFFAIAPNTPMGMMLMGKTEKDTIVFRDQTIQIDKVI